jgi:cyclic pyranopterin phosphate synthase
MVDVSDKPDTQRMAVASGFIRLAATTVGLIRANAVGKGDVLAVARVAGIMAAKRTAGLIPMCHPLFLTDVAVDLDVRDDGVAVRATVRTTGKTGVEMEALVAVSAAALTVYDMCKAVDKSMEIGGIRVLEKRGGRSDRGAAEGEGGEHGRATDG